MAARSCFEISGWQVLAEFGYDLGMALPPLSPFKPTVMVGRVLSALPVLFMLGTGCYFLMNPEKMQLPSFIPAAKGHTILLIEIACALIYLIPYTAFLGAILLTGYFGGAVLTHMIADDGKWFFPLIFGGLVWLGLYLRDPRIRHLIPLRRLPRERT